jgi:hypothetical protein
MRARLFNCSLIARSQDMISDEEQYSELKPVACDPMVKFFELLEA